MSVAQAQEMVAACRDAGVILRIGHQLRLDAAVGRAREIVRSGRLGRLVAMIHRARLWPWGADVVAPGLSRKAA